jgi:signal peptidase II
MKEAAIEPPFTSWARWFVPALVVVLLVDQISKEWLFSLSEQQIAAFPQWIAQWIDLHWNTGVAWGIGSSMPVLVVAITVILIPILCWVWWTQFRPLGAWENLAFGAVLGGAFGNGIDRVLSQFGQVAGVRDFIKIDLNIVGINYVWPTFNVADAGICCGVILLVVLSFFKRPVPITASETKVLV